MESGDTAFTLHDESDGCLAIAVDHPGLQTTVERFCLDEWNHLEETSSCGRLESNGEESNGFCDIELPTALYRRVTDPDVGFACVGIFEEDAEGHGVMGTRIVDRDANGYVLTVAGEGEGSPLHFLSAGGSRIGDPPLDAPSDPIYRFCEAEAAVGVHESEFPVALRMYFDETLQNESIVVFLHAGLDRTGLSGGSFEGNEYIDIWVRVTPTVRRLGVDVERNNAPVYSRELVWLAELLDILDSDDACSDVTTIAVWVLSEVVEGSPDSVHMEYIGTECPS